MVVTLMSVMLLGVSVGEFIDVKVINADETNVTESDEVSIPDDNLRKELQRALGKDVPLTKETLLNITSLNLTYSDITNLTGIEYVSNLKLIDLSGNSVESIEPLGHLHNLESVSLRFNKATVLPDLAPLKTTHVTQLNLVANAYGLEPQKLAAISELTYLENLELQNTKLSVVPDLSKLTKLRSLGMGGNQLTDVSALAGMTGLTELEINSNQITNFEPISYLTNLERIAIGNNRSADVNALKSLTKLKKANFSQMGLSNHEMAVFENMKELEILAIDFNDQISDLSSLRKLTNLSELDFSKDSVSDLTPLANLKNLKVLGFSNNNVSDVSPLKELTALESINMLRNHVYDLSSLKDIQTLNRINAKFQTVTLPETMINTKKESSIIPVLVKSRSANTLPVTLQSSGQLEMTDTGIRLKDIDVTQDKEVYMAWDTDASDKAVKFTGTLTQPVQLKGEDKPEKDTQNKAVKISVLKGDGSNLTSVASNFIQTNALVETQSDGKKSLLIKVIVPKTYGAESITFLHGEKVSTKLVGETYVLEYRFALTDEAVNGTPFKENMHVKINPEVLNYDHRYDVFFKIHGLTNETPEKDTPQNPKEEDTNVNPDKNPNNTDEDKPKNDSEVKPGEKQPLPEKPTDTGKESKPSKEQDVVTYKAHYLKVGTSDTSVMAQYMAKYAEMYYQNGHQYVVISASDVKAFNMIQNMSLNGHTYFKREGTKFFFDLGKQVIQNKSTMKLKGFVHVSTYIPGLGQFKEEQPFTLSLDGRTVKKGSVPDKPSRPNGDNQKQPLTNEQKRTEDKTSTDKQNQKKQTEKKATQKSVKKSMPKKATDDTHNYMANFLKLGTNQTSVMAQYMLHTAQVKINGDKATVTIFAKNKTAANMITRLMIDGQQAVRSGNGFIVTVPKNTLDTVILGHVDVDVPGIIKESQPFSLRLIAGKTRVDKSQAETDVSESGTDVDIMINSNQTQKESNQGDPVQLLKDNQTAVTSESNSEFMTMENPTVKAFQTTGQANNAPVQALLGTSVESQDSQNSDATSKLTKNNDKKSATESTVDQLLKTPNPANVNKSSDPKEQDDMNRTFLILGSVIAALLGFISVTLGWLVFKG